MCIFRKLLGLGVVLAFAAAQQTATAGVVYTYTGNDFTSYDSPYTAADSLTISLTFANPLGNSLGLTYEIGNILAWSVSDGTQTIDQTDGVLLANGGYLTTDPSGNIQYWELGFESTVTSGAVTSDWGIYGAYYPNEDVALGAAYTPTVYYPSYIPGYQGRGWNSDDPGQWSGGGNGVPEPSGGVLASMGGAILLFAMWRRRWLAARTR